MSGCERLILVGGGHSHVEVLRRLALEPVAQLETVVVADREQVVYSGMVPGFVAGQYRGDEIAVDVAALAARAGARWIQARVSRIDPAGHAIELEDGNRIDYALASLDVGSTLAGLDTPGVRQHALASRPIAELVERIGAEKAPARVAVVGGGAAGYELAFCLRARLLARSGSAPPTTLIEAHAEMLPEASNALRRVAERAARERRIVLRPGTRARAVDAAGIELVDGGRIDADWVLWVTGAAPHAFLRDTALPLDAAGFVRVEATLEVAGFEGLFAAGDCAGFPGTKKAGVYAVRQGPILHANLCARLRGEPLQTYVPQHDFLQLLNLGDGSAIAAKWGMAVRGRLAMQLKDRIDRAWMARYA